MLIQCSEKVGFFFLKQQGGDIHVCVLHILEGQCLATVVGGCAGVEHGTARLRGVTAQGDVSPAAQNVPLGARTPLCRRSDTHSKTVCICIAKLQQYKD